MYSFYYHIVTIYFNICKLYDYVLIKLYYFQMINVLILCNISYLICNVSK